MSECCSIQIYLLIGLGYQTQARYSLSCLSFSEMGHFLAYGNRGFPKIPTSLILKKIVFPLSVNAIKQCNIHIYSLSNLGYHTII